jgi:putative transposase
MCELEQFIQQTQESRELTRALAVQNTLVGGRPWKEVARELGVSRAFICKWRSRYKKYGITGLQLGYQGSKSYLSPEKQQQIITWLHEQTHWSVEAVRREIATRYAVVYHSRQSYYDVMHQAALSRKKAQKRHPKQDSTLVAAKREEIEKKR